MRKAAVFVLLAAALLLFATGCETLNRSISYAFTGSPERRRQEDNEAEPIEQRPVDRDSPPPAEAQQAKKERQPGPRFGISVGMMTSSLTPDRFFSSSHAHDDDEFERSYLPKMSSATRCSWIQLSYIFPRKDKFQPTLSFYRFEQEFEGETVLDADLIFEGASFIQGAYVRSLTKLCCAGLRFEGDIVLTEKEEFRFDLIALGLLHYQHYSAKLSSGANTGVNRKDSHIPFLGFGLKFMFYNTLVVFVDLAGMVVPEGPKCLRTSAGLSICITKNLEFSAVYFDQQFSPDYLDPTPGFNGALFTVTVRF